MKTFLHFSLFVFLLMGFTSINSFAQTFEQKVEQQIDSVDAARAKLTKDEQKISAQIYISANRAAFEELEILKACFAMKF